MTDVLPAYAGMILSIGFLPADDGRAPRVCGDDPPRNPDTPGRRYVLPAYAGMILEAALSELLPDGAPRVCGDDPRGVDFDAAKSECSPRMRG